MSDSLRDRIAAALYCHAAQSVATGVPWLNWEDTFPVVREVWLIMADAVIAELGLYREDSEPRTVTNEFGATFRIEGGHRYVTDWKADDE
jgi:hypothetical protein